MEGLRRVDGGIENSFSSENELITPSPEDTLRSLGMTSGDLIYYSLDHSAFVATAQEIELASLVEPHQTLVLGGEYSDGKLGECATLGQKLESNKAFVNDSIGIGFAEVDVVSYVFASRLISCPSHVTVASRVTVELAIPCEKPGPRVFEGLVGSIAYGSCLRRRQWMQISKGISRDDGGESIDLIQRLEKLKEELKSSTTIVRVLYRYLEKLGIRFCITRKALKEPISETETLAQKNSEATRVLGAQKDILEKELGEIQKVLLAMQEQQRKQLELILTIVNNVKLFENSSSNKQVANEKKDNKAEEASTSKTHTLSINQT